MGTESGSVQVFDLRALKVVQKYDDHASKINQIQYQNKTPCLVSVSKDKKLNASLFIFEFIIFWEENVLSTEFRVLAS